MIAWFKTWRAKRRNAKLIASIARMVAQVTKDCPDYPENVIVFQSRADKEHDRWLEEMEQGRKH